jgi:hypothetical protein
MNQIAIAPARRLLATVSHNIHQAIAAVDAFIHSIDQPISDQDWRRVDIAMLTLGAVFLVLNLGFIAFSVLA